MALSASTIKSHPLQLMCRTNHYQKPREAIYCKPFRKPRVGLQITEALIGPAAFGSLTAAAAAVCSSKAEELFYPRARGDGKVQGERTEIVIFFFFYQGQGFFFFLFLFLKAEWS